MKIVYYTSGVSGSGRIITGISIGNALKRSSISADYTIVSSSHLAHLIDTFNFNHIEIEPEAEDILLGDNYTSSCVYQVMKKLQPDILLVDLLWFPLYKFINEMSCKKIFLSRQVNDRFFSIPFDTDILTFDPNQYDRVIATEPFDSVIKMDSINPIIIRNHDEILTREEAARELGLNRDSKNCLVAFNGHPDDFNRIKNEYKELANEGYHMTYTTNYDGGLFPAVDYFNAFDLIVCGAGYNAFWEARFFKKEAVFVTTDAVFVSGQKRLDECMKYKFRENGADQLVKIISSQ